MSIKFLAQLTCLLLFTMSIPLSGQAIKDVRFSAKYQNQPLTDLLEELQKSAGLTFSYLEHTLQQKTITHHFQESGWQEIESFLKNKTGLNVQVLDGGYVTLTPLPPSAARDRPICLRIVDATTQAALPFVTVAIPGRPTSFYSDDDGWCRQQVSAADSDSLEFNFLGYRPQRIALSSVGGADNCPTVALAPSNLELATVNVVEYLTDGIDATAEGHQVVIRPQRIPSLPGFTENEVYRSFQLLPGVNSPDETAAGVNIRGGFRDQTQIVWDGITVYGTGHLGGMISFFSPELVDEVNIWRGPADPAFGGRLSGVINMETDRDITNRISAGANLNLTHANAYLKVPLLKGKSDVHLSGRGTALGLNQTPTFRSLGNQFARNPILESFFEGEDELNESQQLLSDNQDVIFQEFNGRWQWNPTDQHQFTLSVFQQANNKSIELTDPSGFDSYREEQAAINNGLSFTYAGTLSERSQLNVQLARSVHQAESSTSIGENEIPFDNFRENAIQEWSFKAGFQRRITHQHNFKVGLQLQEWTSNTSLEEFQFLDGENLTVGQSFSSTGLAPFGTYQFSDGPWKTDLGMRLQYYEPTAQWYPEPRLSGSYQFHKIWRAKASFGVNHQFLNEIIELDLESLGGSTPIWVLANGEEVSLPSSREYNFGLIGQKNAWLIDLEFYHKRVSNLSSLELLTRNVGQTMFNVADSRSIGMDLLLKRRWGPVRSWIIYTLSRVEARFPEIGNGFSPADNDQRHQLKWVGTYEKNSWLLSLGWQFRSGARFTEVDNIDEPPGEEFSNAFEIDFSRGINTGTLPNYHRLDFSVFYSWGKQSKGLFGKIGLSALNIYGRENPLSISYVPFPDFTEEGEEIIVWREIEKFGLGFTPNLSLSIRWR